MNLNHLTQLAKHLLAGKLSLDQFLHQAEGIDKLSEAQVDIDRSRRCGFPEVIFAQGKTIETLEKIVLSLLEHGSDVLATRMSVEQAETMKEKFPSAVYNSIARTFRLTRHDNETGNDPADKGRVAIVTAGTSDLPVAEEAKETAIWTGASVYMIRDVGVAGPHRLMANLPQIQDTDAVVVVAGMEGALPSVVGGHVGCPVIAVPTSVGYGASFGGVAALLGMLNSCASNVTVVNIDAGFKAGYVAGLIAKNMAKARNHEK
jgi:pyridinium-3,5-biscarboxylic acid mononucleotide synthase